MLVKVKIIGDAHGAFGVYFPIGSCQNVDEKQAEMGESLKVYEIIDRPEPLRNKIPKSINKR